MGKLAGGRDIDIATTLLVDALTCLKRADAPEAADHVMDALRRIEGDYGIVTLDADSEEDDSP